jgi:hypothetical protein
MAADLRLPFEPANDAYDSPPWTCRWVQELRRVKGVSAVLLKARAIRGLRPVVLPFRSRNQP